MSTTRNAVLAAFNTGDTPTEAQFANWINLCKFGITQSRAQIQALIAASNLDTNTIYNLTGGPSSNVLIVFPTAANAISDGAINLTTGEFGEYDITGNTFTAQGGGGSPDWGDIGGTLSDQTDLQTALDGKVATAVAISRADLITLRNASEMSPGQLFSVTTGGIGLPNDIFVWAYAANALMEGSISGDGTVTFGKYDIDANTFTPYDTGVPTLQEVSDEGGFDNGSTLREGLIDHGFGGGISRVCANSKEDQWEDGFKYLIQTIGSTTTVIYTENINNVDPSDNDDETLSYAIGSKWKNIVTGIEYICTDATDGDAAWAAINSVESVAALPDSAIDNTDPKNPIIVMPFTFLTVAPDADNDSTEGYQVGSEVKALDTGVTHLCIDDSIGAAVWIPLSGTDTVAVSLTGAFSGGTSGLVQYYYSRLGNIVTFSVKVFCEIDNYPLTEEVGSARIELLPFLPNATTANNVIATCNIYCTDPTFDGAFTVTEIYNDTTAGGRLFIDFISRVNTANPLTTYRFEITATGQYLIEAP
jgi:hypothetical protein